MMQKKTLLYPLITVIAISAAYYPFKIIKTNYIINDYFNQGRWENLKEQYNKTTMNKKASLFFGDSMTENFKRHMTQSDSLINMGISGDFTEGLITRIDNVIEVQPDRVFIMIGINDIIEKVPLSKIQSNYIELLNLIQQNCSETTIYIQSTLPTRGLKSLLSSSKGINKTVQQLNEFLKETASKRKITYINLYPHFTDENNELKQELTTEGIHLNKKGYEIWESHLADYVIMNAPTSN